jgi:hypothetical protein
LSDRHHDYLFNLLSLLQLSNLAPLMLYLALLYGNLSARLLLRLFIAL